MVTIDFPKIDISQVKIRIGVHTADMSGSDDEAWYRYPKIDVLKQVDNVNFRIASPFGGLIYVVLPSNYNGTQFQVKFSGSYIAPTYIYGETTKEKWNHMINEPEAPWGSIYNRNAVDLVFSIDELQKVSNPEDTLIEFNNGIAGFEYLADVEMSIIPRFTKDYRFDVGWAAYADYPIGKYRTNALSLYVCTLPLITCYCCEL